MIFNTTRIENVDMVEVRKGNFKSLCDKDQYLVKARISKAKPQRCQYIFNLNSCGIYKFSFMDKSFTQVVGKNHMVTVPPLFESVFVKSLGRTSSAIPVFVDDIKDQDIDELCKAIDS